MTGWADAAALPVLLDLLLAAGILRLLGQVSWQRIASAALVAAVRHVATAGIASARRARSGPWDPPRLRPRSTAPRTGSSRPGRW